MEKLPWCLKKLDSELASVLSSEITNYILDDFNFTESQLDRSRPSKNVIENDKSFNEIWEKIRDKYELVDSFGVLNPKLHRYSYVKNYVRSKKLCKIQNRSHIHY